MVGTDQDDGIIASVTSRIKLERLNLRTKLLLAFGIVALLVAVTGLIGVQGVGTVGASADTILEDEVPVADASMEMRIAVEQERAALHAYLLGEQEAKEDFQTASENFDNWHSKMEARDDLTDNQEQVLSKIQSQHEEALQAGQAAIAAKQAGNSEAVTENMEAYDEAQSELLPATDTFEELAGKHMDEAMATADATQSQTRTKLIGLSILAILLAIGIGLFVSGRISKPVNRLAATAQAVVKGDFDSDLEKHIENDEIGTMVDSFKEMRGNLRDVFTEMEAVSESLESGDLDRQIETDFPGAYGDVMTNIETGVDQLDDSFGEIQRASNGLRDGDLDRTLDEDKPGEYGAILSDLNGAIDQLNDGFSQILRASEGLKDGRLDQEFATDLPGTYGNTLSNLEAGFDDVNESIAQVQEIADTVATTSEQVTASTEEIESASHEVAESVQEISHGADEQSDNMQQAANELNDLSATVEEIASSATQVEDNASAAVTKGETGRENAAEATSEINQIEEEAEEAVKQVSSLDAEMEQIGEIIQMINDIAEQTNLLALNASIEAARAGEAGEGFAVVADEIKTLAGEAGDATDEIEGRIAEVQSSTNETVAGIEEMKESVESGAETIEETIQMFDDIAVAIDEVENGVKEISDATDDQATSTEEVVAMVDEVSSVAEETAAEASNMSAAAEEQTSSLTDVGENVENLSKVAEELHELVAQFEVKSGGVEAGMDLDGAQTAAATDGGAQGTNTRESMERQGTE